MGFVAGFERLHHGIFYKIMHLVLLGKPHFAFRGMHVHIYLLIRNLDQYETQGKLTLHQPAGVSLKEAVLNNAASDGSTIHKEVYPARRVPRYFRITNPAGNRDTTIR